MTIGSLNIRLRPIRFGFLVHPNDKKNIQKAIHANSLLWGGMFNPIIPCYKKLPNYWEKYKSKRTTANSVIKGYMEGFDPDYLINLSKLESMTIQFKKENILSFNDVFSNFNEDLTPAMSVGIFETSGQFAFNELRFTRRNKLRIIQPKFSRENNLFLSSMFGDLGIFEEIFYKEYFQDIETESVDINIGNYWNYFSQQFLFPRRLGSIFLEQRIRQPAIFCFDASKSLDIIDFWNLRAAGWDLFPVAKQAIMDADIRKNCEFLIESSYKPYKFNKEIYNHTNIIKSRNIKNTDFENFHNSLQIDNPRRGRAPKVAIQNWYPKIWDDWARENRGQGIEFPFSREKEIALQKDQKEISFKTIDPKFKLFFTQTSQPRFALEVESRIYGSEDLLAEAIPVGGDEISRAVGQSSLKDWRISKSGPVYMPSFGNRTIHYEIPNAEKVLIAWFKENGWEAEISSSGKVAKQMIRQLGGLWGVHQLKDEKLIKFLEELNDKEFISEHTFKGRMSEIVNSDEIWISREQYISHLLEKEIFQLGIELKCSICTQKSWYSFSEIESRVRCNSCLSEYPIQSLPLNDKKWSYKLFGTFGLPKRAHGAFGVLLTLRFLTEDHLGKSTALLSFTAKKKHKELEADLFVVKKRAFREDSRQDFIFAECKTYNKFQKKDIERMKTLANEFPGSVLIFSTFRKTLTTTEKRMLKPIANKGRRYWKAERLHNPVIVLTGTELFSATGIPYCWKELDGKAGDIANSNFYPRTYSEIADATQQIYLDMQPYHEWRKKQWKKRQKFSSIEYDK